MRPLGRSRDLTFPPSCPAAVRPGGGLPASPAEDVVEARVQLDLVLVQVLEQLLSAEHLGYPHQLVVVVVTVEERLLPEDHRGQHAAQRPQVQRVVVHLSAGRGAVRRAAENWAAETTVIWTSPGHQICRGQIILPTCDVICGAIQV